MVSVVKFSKIQDSIKLFDLVPALEPGKAGDVGLFAPDSIVRTVGAKKILVLSGSVATLLQIAHPKVAAGVYGHSRFDFDPLSRLIETLSFMLNMTFGDSEQVAEAVRRVRRKHAPVHGRLGENIGEWKADEEFTAYDPDLGLWVLATLIEPTLDMYGMFYRPLTLKQRTDYYEDYRKFADQMGILAINMHTSYSDFRDYYRSTLDKLVVSDRARAITKALFAAKLNGQPVSPLGPVVAAALMPTQELRSGFGLKWGLAERAMWAGIRVGARSWIRFQPPEVTEWPHARLAWERCKDTDSLPGISNIAA
jgi:uncharacterized protein (DUF2236 family)